MKVSANKKLKILLSIIAIVLCAAAALTFAACTADFGEVQGIYKLFDTDGGSFKSFAYCDLTLEKNGEYALEYKYADSEPVKNKGKFTYKDGIIEFNKGMLYGNSDLKSKYFKASINIDGTEITLFFVLNDLI